ncbi:hypothetical protein DITRI_Ditri11bG0112400 [Diplodiscus trichospermus]
MFENNSLLGIGMVIRDEDGYFLAGKSLMLASRVSVLEGEAIGLKEALSWMKSLNYQRVIFEMDALNVVKALSTPVQDLSEFGDAILGCRSIFDHEVNCKVHKATK